MMVLRHRIEPVFRFCLTSDGFTTIILLQFLFISIFVLYGQQYEGLRDLVFVKVEDAVVCNGSRRPYSVWVGQTLQT